jgi:DNA-binding NtrC family response regulator
VIEVDLPIGGTISSRALVQPPDSLCAIERRVSAIPGWPTSLERRRDAPENRAGGREVLLVDDDAGFVETFSRFLRDAEFTVIAEFTYAGALRYLTAHTPDALITDLRLGDGDGWNLARYARTHQPSLPIVAVTGWSYVSDVEHHDDRIPVFLKPFDPDELLRYLESVLPG